MEKDFTISLDGLKAGRSAYEWHADGKFFDGFENSEILDADIDAVATVEKSGKYIGVDCQVKGDVTVSCDRCLADLKLPVDTLFRLSVKFGVETGTADEGGREIVMLPESDSLLDLSQIVYDYVCLDLPMQRVHEDGGCDPEVVKYLSVSEDEDMAEVVSEPVDNPFASLKDLLERK